MRDSKTLFYDNAPIAAGNSQVVDGGGSEPNIGGQPYLSITASDYTGNMVVALSTSDYSYFSTSQTVSTFLIPTGYGATGGNLFTASLPDGCKRYLRLTLSGASGGTITAGLDWGQANGKAATKPYDV